MRKKTIVFITPGIETGGAEKQLALLAKGLSQDGFVPLIIALSKSGKGQRLADFDGLRVVEINCRKFFQIVLAIHKIRHTIKIYKPDVIQGWMYAGNIMASIAGVGIDAQIYHSLRASDMDAGRYGRIVKLNAILSGYTDGVIANSHAGAEHHISSGFPSSKISIIPNGIDTNKFFPDKKSGNDIRRELGITIGTPVVLYAARVDPMKGHQAVISVAKLCSGMKFIFVGKGTQCLDVPENVLTLGIRHDMEKIYNACDLVISFSEFGEGFPNVIGEAMACGTPVIANNVGDSWRVIGDTGYKIASYKDKAAVSELLETITGSLNKLPKSRIRKQITTSFSLELMISRYKKEYLRV